MIHSCYFHLPYYPYFVGHFIELYVPFQTHFFVLRASYAFFFSVFYVVFRREGSPVIPSITLEVAIPRSLVPNLCGEDGGCLNQIRKVSLISRTLEENYFHANDCFELRYKNSFM
jgi:hypothetical protein